MSKQSEGRSVVYPDGWTRADFKSAYEEVDAQAKRLLAERDRLRAEVKAWRAIAKDAQWRMDQVHRALELVTNITRRVPPPPEAEGESSEGSR